MDLRCRRRRAWTWVEFCGFFLRVKVADVADVVVDSGSVFEVHNVFWFRVSVVWL